MQKIIIEPLEPATFGAFGEIVHPDQAAPRMINGGRCQRYHDLVTIDIIDGHAGISLFVSEAYALPVSLTMMERHPRSSQAFIPLHTNVFLAIVAEDKAGQPGTPRAFLTDGYQGVQYHRNTWHGVLSPISGDGRFVVVDRIGEGTDLEEFTFPEPYLIAQG